MLTWIVRLAMVVAAMLIMWAEGQHQPAPGVGFVLAMALLVGTALVGRRFRNP